MQIPLDSDIVQFEFIRGISFTERLVGERCHQNKTKLSVFHDESAFSFYRYKTILSVKMPVIPLRLNLTL
jgi:hypothetical protein